MKRLAPVHLLSLKADAHLSHRSIPLFASPFALVIKADLADSFVRSNAHDLKDDDRTNISAMLNAEERRLVCVSWTWASRGLLPTLAH